MPDFQRLTKLIVKHALGRRSVALCKFGNVHLPSDLAGFTHIEMGSGHDVSDAAKGHLTHWLDSLMHTIPGVPRTQVVHGYSGVWSVHIEFTKWRRIEITERSFAALEANLHLFIPVDGFGGHGVAQGELQLHLDEPEKHPDYGTYNAHYNLDAEIKTVKCRPDGSMTLMSRTHARQLLEPSGKPWPVEGLDPSVFGPWFFTWELQPMPDEEARLEVKFNRENWSYGSGFAFKI